MNAAKRLERLELALLDADDSLMAIGHRLDLLTVIFQGESIAATSVAISYSLSAITADLHKLRDELDMARNGHERESPTG